MRRFLFLMMIAFTTLFSSNNSWVYAAGKIDERGYVSIGGIEQWIQVTGEDHANPILLVLHGGPGSTWLPWINLFRPWEKHFTLVQWDQRGAGRTFQRNQPSDPATLTIDRMINDGIEVAEHLRQRFNQNKIFILGHSWGSMLGVEMAKRRPNLFHAYVGTGQVTNMQKNEEIGYNEVLRRAREAKHEEAVAELLKIGKPPYEPTIKLATERKWEAFFAHPSEQKFNFLDYVKQLYPADFTAADAKMRNDGFFFSNFAVLGRERMDGPLMAVDLSVTATAFSIPIFIIQGRDDSATPTTLVEDYFQLIQAPKKELVLLPGGHLAVMADPEHFLKEMLRVLALTAK